MLALLRHLHSPLGNQEWQLRCAALLFSLVLFKLWDLAPTNLKGGQYVQDNQTCRSISEVEVTFLGMVWLHPDPGSLTNGKAVAELVGMSHR